MISECSTTWRIVDLRGQPRLLSLAGSSTDSTTLLAGGSCCGSENIGGSSDGNARVVGDKSVQDTPKVPLLLVGWGGESSSAKGRDCQDRTLDPHIEYYWY